MYSSHQLVAQTTESSEQPMGVSFLKITSLVVLVRAGSFARGTSFPALITLFVKNK